MKIALLDCGLIETYGMKIALKEAGYVYAIVNAGDSFTCDYLIIPSIKGRTDFLGINKNHR